MAKKHRLPPNRTFDTASRGSVGAAEEAKAYRDDAAPRINIGEAIRRRIAPFGGIEFEPFPDEILHRPPAVPRRRKK